MTVPTLQLESQSPESHSGATLAQKKCLRCQQYKPRDQFADKSDGYPKKLDWFCSACRAKVRPQKVYSRQPKELPLFDLPPIEEEDLEGRVDRSSRGFRTYDALLAKWGSNEMQQRALRGAEQQRFQEEWTNAMMAEARADTGKFRWLPEWDAPPHRDCGKHKRATTSRRLAAARGQAARSIA